MCTSIFKYSVSMQEEWSWVLNGRISSPHRQVSQTALGWSAITIIATPAWSPSIRSVPLTYLNTLLAQFTKWSSCCQTS